MTDLSTLSDKELITLEKELARDSVIFYNKSFAIKIL